ncbi:hypothetical protein P3X46_021304 [Hevea brasiliensis]|uniref:RRM domain-containing protein n=1 Tax=Hevea brasiliensis TaxID=3981 RepID=A0ABQ9LH73_HEVBR|nr:uncharacterized protein LOC110649943 [Hevea brasiliensis]KAJ9166572.1 hypothetical protein P3X46_021304 [Hevea brasiliensis]
MAYPHYRSQFGDTTFTKVFVGGLAWETPTEEMRRYFEQFGEILEAVIITDKDTGKSKGYGFVTFREPESAARACADPKPVIDGRKANCNIASLGRPRPSTPRGRPQGGSTPYQGSPSYSGVATPLPPPPPPPRPPPPPVFFPHFGYPPYTPGYGYHQAIYNTQVQHPQYYHQVYGTSSSAMGSPYYYHGYSLQPPREARSAPQPLRLPGPPSYFYYPSSTFDPSFSTYPPPPTIQPTRHPFPSSTDSQQTPQHPTTETEAGVVTSEISNP